MVAAGLLGFVMLSGDFGDATDAPPVDGWSQRSDRAAPPRAEFNRPEFAETAPVTVRREPTGEASSERNWSNPAEGEIAAAPSEQPGPAMPNWMSGNAMPALPQPSPTPENVPAQDAAASHETAQAAAHKAEEELKLAPPQNEPPSPSYQYPTTGAAGLNAPSPAGEGANQSLYPGRRATYPTTQSSYPSSQSTYPTTGYGAGSPITAGQGAGPAARTGMHAPAPPSYPTTGVAPSSGFPNDVPPPVMSPRYERIR